MRRRSSRRRGCDSCSLVEPDELFPTDEPFHRQADLRADMGGRAFVVAREHLELDPEPLQAGDRLGSILPSVGPRRRGSRAARAPARRRRCSAGFTSIGPLGQREHSMAVIEEAGERRIDLLAELRERPTPSAGEPTCSGRALPRPRPCRAARRAAAVPSSTTDVRRRSNVNGSVATRSTPRQLGLCDSRLEAAPDRQVECVAERRSAVLEVELAAEQPLEVQIAHRLPRSAPTASR